MSDSGLHADIIRAMDVYDKAKPLVAQLRAEIDRDEEAGIELSASVASVAARLEKLFEEENDAAAQ